MASIRADKILVLLLISACCLPQFCFAEKSGSKVASRKKKKLYSSPIAPIEDKTFKPITLTGGVKHSESLPPINSKLTVGASFDQKKLEVEKPPPSRNWYKVPSFLAGTWESDTQSNISIDKNGKKTISNTVKNHGIAHYGVQCDSKGGVWDYVYVPIEVQNEAEKAINKDLTTQQVILKNTPNLVVLKDVFTRRRIDKSTNKIIELIQMEQISTITPAGENQIELVGSLKEFDQKGKTLGLTNAVITYKRTSHFHQDDLDKKTREPLQPSFHYYLKTHGMENLIPKKP